MAYLSYIFKDHQALNNSLVNVRGWRVVGKSFALWRFIIKLAITEACKTYFLAVSLPSIASASPLHFVFETLVQFCVQDRLQRIAEGMRDGSKHQPKYCPIIPG